QALERVLKLSAAEASQLLKLSASEAFQLLNLAVSEVDIGSEALLDSEAMRSVLLVSYSWHS
ncbi:hypothetical protein A2U01_0076732, partial [Trifolium medium]|nr:hypothetical protein [Trifolium medium]